MTLVDHEVTGKDILTLGGMFNQAKSSTYVPTPVNILTNFRNTCTVLRLTSGMYFADIEVAMSSMTVIFQNSPKSASFYARIYS